MIEKRSSSSGQNLQKRFGRSNGATAVSNSGDSLIRGFELQQNLLYGNLDVSAHASYLDAKYTRFFVSQNLQATIPGVPAFLCSDPVNNSNNDCADYAGSTFAGTPKWQAGATIRYTLPISEDVGRIVPSVTIAYQSAINYADFPLLEPEAVGPAYTLFNARIEWNKIFGSSLRGAVYVRNLTNLGREAWIGANAGSTGIGVLTATFIEPRTFGAELRFDF